MIKDVMTSKPERNNIWVFAHDAGEHREINVVLGKALNVLSDTELLEPVRNLLHRGRTRRVSRRTSP
jgi:hypothetical protein